jgi:hypothetical protein
MSSGSVPEKNRIRSVSSFRTALTKRYGEAGALTRGAKRTSTKTSGVSSSSSGMIAEGSGANPSSDTVMHPIQSGLTAPGLKAIKVSSGLTAPGLKAQPVKSMVMASSSTGGFSGKSVLLSSKSPHRSRTPAPSAGLKGPTLGKPTSKAPGLSIAPPKVNPNWTSEGNGGGKGNFKATGTDKTRKLSDMGKSIRARF